MESEVRFGNDLSAFDLKDDQIANVACVSHNTITRVSASGTRVSASPDISLVKPKVVKSVK